MKKLLFAILVLSFAASVSAQTTPQYIDGTEKVAFSQAASTLTEANNFQYRLVIDGNRIATPISGVVCTGSASPYSCVSPNNVLPTNLSLGTHTVALTTALVSPLDGSVLESVVSASVSVQKIAPPTAPTAPTLIRIIK